MRYLRNGKQEHCRLECFSIPFSSVGASMPLSSCAADIQGSCERKLLGPPDFVVCHMYWRVDIDIYKVAVFVM
jgi:hypothetical protein